MITMNKVHRSKQIKALRRAKGPQCKHGTLHGPDNSYCALVVLARTAKINTTSYEDSSPYDRIAELTGLDKANHDVIWKLNDTEGKSFKEIADYVKTNIKGI